MKIQTVLKVLQSAIIIVLIGSCQKEDDKGFDPTPTSLNTTWILNEGNFGWGNASIGRLNLEEALYVPNVFEQVNQRPLGDVLQSGMVYDEALYLVLNNSGTIEVVDPYNAKLIRTLRVGASPRYLSPIANTSHALLTDLYGGFVRKINLSTGDVLETITIPGWNEKIFAFNSGVHVVMNLTSQALFFIDPHHANVIDSVVLPGKQMRDMVMANHGHALYVCMEEEHSKGVVFEISDEGIATKRVSLEFSPRRMVVDGDYAFCVSGAWIYRVHLQSGQVDAWIKLQEGTVPYGLAIDKDQNLWLMDAADYVQQGRVYIFNEQADLLNTFSVGAIPSQVVFVN